MKENFLSRAKADGTVFVKAVGLMAKLGKLKMEVQTKKAEKASLLKNVGTKVVEIVQNRTASKPLNFLDACAQDLDKVERIDARIAELEAQMESARRQFRGEQVHIEETPQQGAQ